MLGLRRGTVALVSHNENWHRLFDVERSRIFGSVGEHVFAVEHVGSTAICGISAKPILDIAVGVGSFDDGFECVAGIEALGYEYKGENGVPGRHFFGKGIPRTHHLHLVAVGSDFWSSHLAFRDHLNADPDTALEYDRLKKELADRYSQDREGYTNGKEAFIQNVLRKMEFERYQKQ